MYSSQNQMRDFFGQDMEHSRTSKNDPKHQKIIIIKRKIYKLDQGLT